MLAVALAACGGATGKPTVGGESHFLNECVESCAGGLECLAGVCTRQCDPSGPSCSELSPLASCVEQGDAGAVCDVPCDQDRDCSPLGNDFGCPAGLCRAGSQSQNPPAPGNSGGGGGGDGGGGDAGAPAFEPFDPQCKLSQAPGFASECSFEATCAELSCGDGFSQFGLDGCTRYCKADADCGDGERCRHTILAITDEECPSPGSEVEDCYLMNGKCSCSITENCVHPSICVDAAAYPESEDCPVDGADCSVLDRLEANAQGVLDRGESNERNDQAVACLSRVRSRRVELACPPNRLIPFLPECEQPVGFQSNCGFEATCQQLGCGDGLSQFDANGCTRYCQTTADCGVGQRCRHTSLVLSEEECPSPGSEIEGCSMTGDTCECSETLDCPRPDICVDVTTYPESLDCVTDGASCLALANGDVAVQSFLDAASDPDAVSEAEGCLDAIHAQQQTLGCGN